MTLLLADPAVALENPWIGTSCFGMAGRVREARFKSGHFMVRLTQLLRSCSIRRFACEAEDRQQPTHGPGGEVHTWGHSRAKWLGWLAS